MDIDEVIQLIMAELGDISKEDREGAIKSVITTETIAEGLLRAANTLINERNIDPSELSTAMLKAASVIVRGPEDISHADVNLMVKLLSQMLTFRMMMAFEAKLVEEEMEKVKAVLEASKQDQNLH